VATVADIMDADPITVTPEASVEDVVRVLKENELPGLPVVNEGGRCVGIITEADLVIADDEGDLHIPHYVEVMGGVIWLDFHHLNPLARFDERLRKATASTAQDMMTADPVTIESSAAVKDAARIIAEEGHNRLPVTDHGRLVGIVTRVDVLQALAAE